MNHNFRITRATLILVATWLLAIGYCAFGMYANTRLNMYYTGLSNILWITWIIAATLIAIGLIGKTTNKDNEI